MYHVLAQLHLSLYFTSWATLYSVCLLWGSLHFALPSMHSATLKSCKQGISQVHSSLFNQQRLPAPLRTILSPYPERWVIFRLPFDPIQEREGEVWWKIKKHGEESETWDPDPKNTRTSFSWKWVKSREMDAFENSTQELIKETIVSGLKEISE